VREKGNNEAFARRLEVVEGTAGNAQDGVRGAEGDGSTKCAADKVTAL